MNTLTKRSGGLSMAHTVHPHQGSLVMGTQEIRTLKKINRA